MGSQRERTIERRRFLVSLTLAALPVGLIALAYPLQGLDRHYLYWLGIYPRSVAGLVGILAAPFIHSDGQHLLSNLIPLLILGCALWYFYPSRAPFVLLAGWLGSGIGTWLIGRASYHVGASGLLYGLAAYIITAGFIGRRRGLAALALIVIFLYGSMVWGIFPYEPSYSWESHFCGALAGVILAFADRKSPTLPDQGIGYAEGHQFSTVTHTGAPSQRVRYRVRR